MSVKEEGKEKAFLQINNIGGIVKSEADIARGVTVLAGRNATNRTSLLQGIMAGLGSDQVSLKGDANEGNVFLTVEGKEFTRTLRRENGRVVFGGEPYLEDSELADLFAFLLESNEARQAVVQRRDLREVIMDPVDTEAIEAKIRELQSERSRIEEKLEQLESLERQLPTIEEKHTQLESKIQKKRDELEDRRGEVETKDAELEDQHAEKEALDEKLSELNLAQRELENTIHNLNGERDSIDALGEEREGIEQALKDLAEADEARLEEINEEIGRLRGRIDEIESTVSELQTVIQFNEDLLSEHSHLVQQLQASEGGSVTDALVTGEETMCWTCGSVVSNDQIHTTLKDLRELRSEKMQVRNELREEVDELTAERSELERVRQTRERLSGRIEQIDAEIEDRGERVEELEDRRLELEETISDLEASVEDLRTEAQEDLLDVHKELNQLEVELARLDDELEDITSEIEDIENKLEDRESLQKQKDEVDAEIEELRGTVGRLEREAVEQFNARMDEVLSLLEYENLDRVWIERTEREVREGRHKVAQGRFDLHVVRSTPDGSAYEDTVDHLSESEREVTGLVFALAGYLAHTVHEHVPFMLLDSIEALDATRIATLIDYLKNYADYLVVALLEEDAQTLPETYHRIESI